MATSPGRTRRRTRGNAAASPYGPSMPTGAPYPTASASEARGEARDAATGDFRDHHSLRDAGGIPRQGAYAVRACVRYRLDGFILEGSALDIGPGRSPRVAINYASVAGKP